MTTKKIYVFTLFIIIIKKKKKLKEKYSHRQSKEERKEEGCHLQEAFPEVVFNLCQPMEPPPQGFCALLSFPRRPEE